MMRTFLYFATSSGQLGSRKHFDKIAFSFQNAHLMEHYIQWGWGWERYFLWNSRLIISLGHVTKKINSKLRRVSQISKQITKH